MEQDCNKKKKIRKKHDFGKKVIDYTFIMMFCHFGWMCFLSYRLKSAEILVQFTHDFKWIYLTIFGLTIWKEKFIMVLQKAKEFGIKKLSPKALGGLIPKDTELPSDNSFDDMSGYGFGGDTLNIDTMEG